MFADEIAFARKDRELFFPSPPLTCSQREVHGKKCFASEPLSRTFQKESKSTARRASSRRQEIAALIAR